MKKHRLAFVFAVLAMDAILQAASGQMAGRGVAPLPTLSGASKQTSPSASQPARASASPSAGTFTLDDVLCAPYPSELVAARDADRIAWAFNGEGARNLWTAAAPDYAPVRLTSYAKDEVFELGDVALTNDGAIVVYVRGGAPDARGWVTNPTSDPAGVEQAVWAVRTSGGSPWRLGPGAGPAVSPDGRWVLIFKDNQIFRVPLLDPSGSTEKPAPELLFKAAGRNHDPVWSPDGARVAFVSDRGEHSFVGVFDLRNRGIVWLEPSVDRDFNPSWSPDGTRVAFFRRPGAQYNERPEPGNPPNPAVWIADAATGRGNLIYDTAAKSPKFHTVSHLAWTASDRLLFTAEREEWDHVYSLAAPAGGAAAGSAAEAVDLTPGRGEVESFGVSRDGALLYYSSNHADIHGRHIWKAPTAPGGAPVQLTTGATLGFYPAVLAGGREAAFLYATASQPLSVALVPSAGGPSRIIAPAPLPARFPLNELVVPELVIVKADDGLDVPCQLFLPKGAKAGDGRPGVVFTHGGPMRQMFLGWHNMEFYSEAYGINQYFANRGFVVLSINYRSGIGYGRPFRLRPDAGPRGASQYKDLVAGAKYLRGRPEVDRDRVGLWGLSYGGYMTALGLARNSDIFKAGVDLAGVHDWSAWMRAAAESASDKKLAFDSSPAAGVESWTSPVLFIHGDDDRNVDFAQTVDLVQKLRAKGGVHIELMVRPDEPHEFLLHKNRLDAYAATFEFLDRFLAGK